MRNQLILGALGILVLAGAIELGVLLYNHFTLNITHPEIESGPVYVAPSGKAPSASVE